MKSNPKTIGSFVLGGLLAVIGIISIILGCCAFNQSSGSYESSLSYGGDAYTGIQNAGAQTANNVMYGTDASNFGFGSILLIMGLTLDAAAIALIIVGVAYVAKDGSNNKTSQVKYRQPVKPEPQFHKSQNKDNTFVNNMPANQKHNPTPVNSSEQHGNPVNTSTGVHTPQNVSTDNGSSKSDVNQAFDTTDILQKMRMNFNNSGAAEKSDDKQNKTVEIKNDKATDTPESTNTKMNEKPGNLQVNAVSDNSFNQFGDEMSDEITRLEQFAEMKDRGIISEHEFQEKKKELLDKI